MKEKQLIASCFVMN